MKVNFVRDDGVIAPLAGAPPPPRSEACSTCPFRAGNDAEFCSKVLKMRAPKGTAITQALRLLGALVMRPVVWAFPGFVARRFRELAHHTAAITGGQFICHDTAYDFSSTALQNMRPQEQWQLCAGAAPLRAQYAADPLRGFLRATVTRAFGREPF